MHHFTLRYIDRVMHRLANSGRGHGGLSVLHRHVTLMRHSMNSISLYHLRDTLLLAIKYFLQFVKSRLESRASLDLRPNESESAILETNRIR